jgi:hypothetical protein
VRSGDVRFGTAYFGVRDPDHFSVDLAEIADSGYDWVLLPFTQDDAAWERETFAALVSRARALGLTTVVSPWGGDEFGGEGVQGGLSTVEWLARAKATGADVLHVDEPRVSTVTLPGILDQWGDDAAVWLTIQPDRASVLDPETIRRVGVLGTDAYEGDLTERVEVTRAFGAATGRLDLAWVQAFRIGPGEEVFVGAVAEALAAVAPRIGVWGWKGSTGRGVLRSARPTAVEDSVRRAIERVGAGRVEPAA